MSAVNHSELIARLETKAKDCDTAKSYWWRDMLNEAATALRDLDAQVALGKSAIIAAETLRAERDTLRELIEQIDSLDSIAFSRDMEPYKAEAVWDDALSRARRALETLP